jgi:hypothetical protein
VRFRTERDGKWFEFDQDRLLVKEARMLEELTGMGLQEFGQGLQRGKVDSIVFMIFLSHKREGLPVQWRDFDELDLAALEIEQEETEAEAEGPADGEGADTPAEAVQAAAEGAAGARPTRAAAPAKKSSRKRAAATTSA